jgi:NAD(P)-dependent dehydrogenase (short-subunit alcohol dehydrogenase family)
MSDERVAVVTGAARGLGRGIAARLLSQGWRVALVDMGDAAATAAELDATGGRALGVHADVTDADACMAAVDAAVTAFGSLRALVNNAGIGGPSTPVHLTSPSEFRRVIEVNLVGAFLMTRAAVPHLLRTGGGGAIVNITSVLGQRAEAGSGAYSASKGGLGLLGQSMALELADAGIRVNSVAPGNMLTEMHRQHVQSIADRAGIGYDEALARVRSTVPLGRHGTPEDVGDAVAWLLSDGAAYVTGQTVAVNGGILLT